MAVWMESSNVLGCGNWMEFTDMGYVKPMDPRLLFSGHCGWYLTSGFLGTKDGSHASACTAEVWTSGKVPSPWNILEQGSRLSKPFHFSWKKDLTPWQFLTVGTNVLICVLDLKAVFDASHLCALQSEKVAASSWSPSYSLGEIERHSWYSWLVA